MPTCRNQRWNTRVFPSSALAKGCTKNISKPTPRAAIERSMHRLFKDILAGGPGAPPDFDFERYNLSQTRKYDGLTLDELIDRFTEVRQETIRIVREMQEEDLDREGLHAFHGKGKLDRFIRWAYEHTRIHEDDICKALKKIA